MIKPIPTLVLFAFISILNAQAQFVFPYRQTQAAQIRCGAERTQKYFPMLQQKRIAITTNHTAYIGEKHIVDSLAGAGFDVRKVFAPEHGFRGKEAAGAHIGDGIDPKTGIPVLSLYGKKKKPEPEDLQDVDIVLFDIQDVGVRFYTYISTMSYMMEACAEAGIPFIVLDRPNPHGHYVDGPILEDGFSSFVGLHPVPVVHGMTIGEYARMVNGEGWLQNGKKCQLQVIPVAGYTHTDLYQLPIPPSPNLPNMAAVYLYPSLAFFEGSNVSVARGTDFPFQAFGHPDLHGAPFRFTPESRQEAPRPPQLGKECKGYHLEEFGGRFIRNYRQLYLYWLIETYRDLGGEPSFFLPFFDKLAGSDMLRKQIISGLSESQIRESWQEGLNKYKLIRKKYLLYPDFE
jgi:uncharacterized protein YbbC (DUF1343 family)